jgi:hypothetical protein
MALGAAFKSTSSKSIEVIKALPESRGWVNSLIRAYGSSRWLNRALSLFLHHFHLVNLLLLATAVDLALSFIFPAGWLRATYILLAICGILGALDAIARVRYIIQTRSIQSEYSAVLKAWQNPVEDKGKKDIGTSQVEDGRL